MNQNQCRDVEMDKIDIVDKYINKDLPAKET